ncbi:MAG: CDP-glucose 4,6-dehydratase, partial [Ignavibacteria bacterium]|nr:CDP-glucose 4,6-dehydratase [Ignavibacteria bacterium]
VMGLVNLCEVIKDSDYVRNVIIVTSDKCYLNEKGKNRFKEGDALGGLDPYSASKSCAEIIAKSYANSFFIEKGISSATVRAGNIIGGGDWSRDRLIPDIIRSFYDDKPLIIRNPYHVRPWQHVLEALAGYLKTGEKLIGNESADFTSWNFGPDSERDFNVSGILELFMKYFNKKLDVSITQSEMIHESEYLRLDSQKAKQLLKWYNIWDTEKALEKTSEWYKEFYKGSQKAHELCREQIIEYENSLEKLIIKNI